MFDVMGPLPGPQQLPVLANITIEPGRFPDWEQQCSTTEAYARRPPPGVTISPGADGAKPSIPNSLDATPSMAYSTPHDSQTPQINQPYASPPYHPRDLERRAPMQYSPQPPYGQERHQGYYDGRPGQARPSYPPPFGGYLNGGPGLQAGDPYYSGVRRERSPPRDGQPYLASPPMQYPRDRYPENAPSYTPPTYAHPWAGQGQYRAPPEIRTTFDDSSDPQVVVVDHGNGKLLDDQQLSVSRLPPTPNSANPASPLPGPSPKLSINNNLLNPSDEAGRNTLTLPPLSRMGHEAGSPISSSGRKSPIGEALLPSEDARQLDGLGRRV
jgi:hypothetical protein